MHRGVKELSKQAAIPAKSAGGSKDMRCTDGWGEVGKT
nr:MAG TPA: hypothetical protein [Bacteriophage sp.]